MANMDIINGKYVYTNNVTMAGTKTVNLVTENKFVDKNIQINTVTPAGSLVGGATTASATDVENILTEALIQPSSGEYITVTAQGSANISVAGFLAQGTNTTSSPVTKYYTLQTATFTAQGPAIVTTRKGYVDNGVTVGTISAGAQTITGGDLTPGATTAVITSDGYYDGSGYDTTDKVQFSTVQASGYYRITGSGSATVNRAAVTKQVTTAGYFSADADPISAVSADSLTVSTPDRAYYIKKANISISEITPSTTTQTITIGEGYVPSDRIITISPMATGDATSSVSTIGISTYFDQGNPADNSIIITPQHIITTSGYLVATISPVDGDPLYYKIKSASMSQGTSSVSGTTVTRGTASWNTGWIDSGSINAAVFGNHAANGKTASSYLDISLTTSAPVLVSGDYLYINKGYTDDLKISLAKLVPDGSDVKGHREYILSGHTAYDDDGELVTGSIETYLGEYTIA